MDYNKKYKFISKKNEWFIEGTECLVDETTDGPGSCIWDSTKELNSKKEITYEDMINHSSEISGIFKGMRLPDNKNEIEMFGTKPYLDGELCGMEEFEIIIKE